MENEKCKWSQGKSREGKSEFFYRLAPHMSNIREYTLARRRIEWLMGEYWDAAGTEIDDCFDDGGEEYSHALSVVYDALNAFIAYEAEKASCAYWDNMRK